MNDVVEFHKGPELIGLMPAKIFNVLIDIWVEGLYEDCEFHDASIKEIFVNVNDRLGGEFYQRLSYNHWHLDMSYTTWYYIARSNYGRSKPFWRIRLMRKLFGNWI
jgi:hypothetical protein